MKGINEEYEVIVIGAGLNGLTAAAYLQKAGLKVALFERRDEAGAMCTTEELSMPGAHMNLHASQLHPHMGASSADLCLWDFGYEPVTATEWGFMTPFRDGSAVLHHICDARKQYEAWKRISSKDAETYRRIINYLGPRWPDYLHISEGQVPTDENLEKLFDLISGIPGLPHDWMDMNGIEVADLMFEDDRIKCSLMGKAIGSGISPDERGLGAISPIHGMTGFMVQWNARGGSHALTHSLVRCFLHYGGSIFQGCPVEKLLIDGGEAKGVFLAKDSVYPEAQVRASKAVVSNLAAGQTFLQLVGADKLSPKVVSAVKNIDYNGTSLFTNFWVTKGQVQWNVAKKFPEAQKAWAFYFGIDTIADIERVGNDMVADRLPDPPVATGGSSQGYVIADPTQAPPGFSTLLVWSKVPYDLRRLGGPQKWDQIREDYADKVEDLLAEYAPNIKEVKVDRYVATPFDSYRRNPAAIKGGFLGGQITNTQFWDNRPFPGCGAPRTPIHKLYISNSMWPGGSTSLTSGNVAAQCVAEDLGVRDQPWWTHKAMDEYPAMVAKYGWEYRPAVD